MSKREYEGTAFGFIFVVIWLLLLTGFVMYDRMNANEGLKKVIVLPPPIEVIDGYNFD